VGGFGVGLSIKRPLYLGILLLTLTLCYGFRNVYGNGGMELKPISQIFM
jgi:hypothetical protein